MRYGVIVVGGICFPSSPRPSFACDADPALFYLTQRGRSDHFLIEQAVKAGPAVLEPTARERDLLPELQIAFQLWSPLHLAPVLSSEMLFHQLTGKLSRRFGWTRFSHFLQGEDRYRDLGPFWWPIDWTIRPTLFPRVAKILGVLKR